jgi:hypothetical protein
MRGQLGPQAPLGVELRQFVPPTYPGSAGDGIRSDSRQVESASDSFSSNNVFLYNLYLVAIRGIRTHSLRTAAADVRFNCPSTELPTCASLCNPRTVLPLGAHVRRCIFFSVHSRDLLYSLSF